MLTLCDTCNRVHRASLDSCPHCTGHRKPGRTASALLGLTMLAACGRATALYAAPVEDLDGDGYFEPEDCDDSDPNVHPGAEETAGDEVDSNCDGEDDPIEA